MLIDREREREHGLDGQRECAGADPDGGEADFEGVRLSTGFAGRSSRE
jgi:hypothetical protein